MFNVQNQACKILNKYYNSAASAIGQRLTAIREGSTLEDVLEKRKVHPSVKYNRHDSCMDSTFELQLVSEQTITSKLLILNVKSVDTYTFHLTKFPPNDKR